MHKMEMLRDRLCDELDELTSVEKINTSSLDTIDKLTHSIKSIDTILAMEQSKYSNGYSYAGRGGNDGYSNAWNLSRVPDMRGYSYANRDNMGRYSNKWEDKESIRAELMERIRELDEQR